MEKKHKRKAKFGDLMMSIPTEILLKTITNSVLIPEGYEVVAMSSGTTNNQSYRIYIKKIPK